MICSLSKLFTTNYLKQPVGGRSFYTAKEFYEITEQEPPYDHMADYSGAKAVMHKGFHKKQFVEIPPTHRVGTTSSRVSSNWCAE